MKLFLCCLLIYIPLSGFGQNEDGKYAPFTSQVLNILPAEDAFVLFNAVKYLNSDYSSQLNESQSEKAYKLSAFLGDDSPAKDRMSESFAKERSRVLFMKFADRQTLLKELVRVATIPGDPEGKAAGAHILDFVLDMDPTMVDAAYEREKLFVTDNIRLNWDAGPHDDRAGKSGSLNRKGDLMSESSSGVFEVDFSRMSIGGSGSSFEGVARNQSLVKGLLVQTLSGSQFAGSASQMNATVLGKGSSGSMTVRFNQEVGEMMTDAVDHMMEYLKLRHKTLPEGVEVELGFEEQYIPKDGPSAGVACTLMLEAILKDYEYSPSFAVTGALDGKGIVGGVGGVDGKIRGAIARKCDLVAIPSDNEKVISDLLILEGPETLAKIQVVEIETFDQALKIAKKHEHLDPEIKQAIESFREVQKVLNQRGGISYLRNFKLQQKLREVLKTMPNHLSAKYLLLKGMNREPGSLTLMGSVQAIDRNAAPLINALREGVNVQDRLRNDSFADTMSALTRLRPLLDDRTRPCADAIVKFSGFIRTAINSPPRSPSAITDLNNNLRSSGRAVGREYDRLFDRPDVKAELMTDDEDE